MGSVVGYILLATVALAKRAEEILEKPPVGLLELPDDELEILVGILARVRPG